MVVEDFDQWVRINRKRGGKTVRVFNTIWAFVKEMNDGLVILISRVNYICQ